MTRILWVAVVISGLCFVYGLRGEDASSDLELLYTATTIPSVRSLQVVVEITASDAFYEVAGATSDEILRSIDDNAPVHGDGRASGVTAVHRIFEPASLCTAAVGVLSIHMEILLPRHATPSGAGIQEPLARERWAHFVDEVRRHEDEHQRIERELAERVRVATESLDPTSACEVLQAQVATIWDDELDRARSEHTAFDSADRRRLEGLREPLLERIGVLQGALESLERSLEDRRAEIGVLDHELRTIVARNPSGRASEPDFSRYSALLATRTALVTEHNQLVDARSETARELETLVVELNWYR